MRRPILALLAVLALAVPASAQFGSPRRQETNAARATLVRADGSRVTFADESSRRFVDLATGATVTPETTVRDGAKLKDADTGEVLTVRVPGRYLSLGLYFSSFGIAGPIQQNDGSFLGGTDNANNIMFSLDAGIPSPLERGTLSVGGWYFPSPKGGDNDLYQVHVKYGLPRNNPLGFQVAYLNAQNRTAPALTLHATYTLSSARIMPAAKPWGVEFGAGIINSYGDQIEDDGSKRKRNSVDPSFYVNTNWTIAPRVSALATLWVVRERNQDLTRMALGVSYRF